MPFGPFHLKPLQQPKQHHSPNLSEPLFCEDGLLHRDKLQLGCLHSQTHTLNLTKLLLYILRFNGLVEFNSTGSVVHIDTTLETMCICRRGHLGTAVMPKTSLDTHSGAWLRLLVLPR